MSSSHCSTVILIHRSFIILQSSSHCSYAFYNLPHIVPPPFHNRPRTVPITFYNRPHTPFLHHFTVVLTQFLCCSAIVLTSFLPRSTVILTQFCSLYLFLGRPRHFPVLQSFSNRPSPFYSRPHAVDSLLYSRLYTILQLPPHRSFPVLQSPSHCSTIILTPFCSRHHTSPSLFCICHHTVPWLFPGPRRSRPQGVKNTQPDKLGWGYYRGVPYLVTREQTTALHDQSSIAAEED